MMVTDCERLYSLKGVISIAIGVIIPRAKAHFRNSHSLKKNARAAARVNVFAKGKRACALYVENVLLYVLRMQEGYTEKNIRLKSLQT